MKNRTLTRTCLVLAAAMAIPVAAAAEPVLPATVASDMRADMAPESVVVQFGQNQFPQDPSPNNHFMDPNEVTVAKGGTVTFEINGGNHGIAIYPVSRDTTRESIEAGLCQPDPATCDPQGTATSDLEYFVLGGNGELIIDTQANPPSNRIDDPTDRLVYAGGPVFFSGRTASGAPAPQLQYRFEKTGRYLVVCINRGHLINDRMFGFVNVVRKRQRSSD